MIKVRNVTYGYKKENDILKDITIDIKDNETIVVMGRNGSGKSTLGKLISGIIRPKEGKILIDDLDIADKKNKEEIRKKIGIVFQNPENQIIFNNIKDELSFALKDLKSEEVEKRIHEVLSKVHMEDKIKDDLYELSLGQKQRIVISEILAKHPKYIVFDEPTTMIDSKGKEKIHNIIEELKKEGYTILYITNMAEEILLADRILILDNGRIVEEIKREELLDKLQVMEQYDIKIPVLLEILQELKKEKFEINLKDYSVQELVIKLKEMIKK
ncbi:ATP-binding cassette domain-containing protein [uncultured Clostridium sp.]|uniref:ATP-binding cassette domain-containing protein n=1 Tax=uncultured Clostridium sp. TaxID=59620 RepID=UPI002637E426|nr:ATP-binding cassette domain-containing protein [uncultured Clostridium sp.]